MALVEGQPLIVGLCGRMASGKTGTADLIVPKGRMNYENNEGIYYDHIYFAQPIYALLSAKRIISGENELTRKKYAIHNILTDVYGPVLNLGVRPHYDELVDLVDTIYEEKVEAEGKPRAFLQWVGDVCRAYNKDCFAEWAVRKVMSLHSDFTKEKVHSDDRLCVIVSDVRFENEARYLMKRDNTILIRFDVNDKVQKERLLDRDGYIPDVNLMNHKSELELDLYSDLVFKTIDSSDMTLAEQASETLQTIREWIN